MLLLILAGIAGIIIGLAIVTGGRKLEGNPVVYYDFNMYVKYLILLFFATLFLGGGISLLAYMIGLPVIDYVLYIAIGSLAVCLYGLLGKKWIL